MSEYLQLYSDLISNHEMGILTKLNLVKYCLLLFDVNSINDLLIDTLYNDYTNRDTKYITTYDYCMSISCYLLDNEMTLDNVDFEQMFDTLDDYIIY